MKQKRMLIILTAAIALAGAGCCAAESAAPESHAAGEKTHAYKTETDMVE